MGLDPQGYGNPDFCWLSIHDSLVWSLAGPSACAVAVSREGMGGGRGLGDPWVPIPAPPRPLTPSAPAPQVSIFFLVLAARATCATPQGFEKKGTG